MVDRSGRAPAPDGVEVVAGARAVHQALSPPYRQWQREFPRLQAGGSA
jgi:hypothetical protein